MSLFGGFSLLYWLGPKGFYISALRAYGFEPFHTPFIDIGALLAAWQCTRLGIDVLAQNPCDVLGRLHVYSPAWLRLSWVPLDVGSTEILGWGLGLSFLVSLYIIPKSRSWSETAIVTAASTSSMVAYAVERANPDLIIFLLVVLGGLLLRGRGLQRAFAYSAFVIGGLIKYYPFALLILMLRENSTRLLLFGAVIVGLGCALVVGDYSEVRRALALIPEGSYFGLNFGAKNLPFGLAKLLGIEQGPLRLLFLASVFVILLGSCAATCRKVLRNSDFRRNYLRLAEPERVFMSIGAIMLAGCFFAGQNNGYRAVFLLLVIPGLLAISRERGYQGQTMCRTAAIVAVLLMWEPLVYDLLANLLSGKSDALRVVRASILFVVWLSRELAWWWIASVLASVALCCVTESQVIAQTTKNFRTVLVQILRV